MLAKAAANVLEQFDITPDPKTQAIIGLVMACGAVYGPRALVYSRRKAGERKAETTEGTAAVYNANGGFAGTTPFTEVPNS
jgi:hypothetical protein